MAPAAQPGRGRRKERLPAPWLPTARLGTASRSLSGLRSRRHRRPGRQATGSPNAHGPNTPPSTRSSPPDTTVRRPATRHESQHHPALLPSHRAGRPFHRPVARPPHQAQYLCALPGPAMEEGCTNAWMPWAEIKEQGYPNGYGNVRAAARQPPAAVDRSGHCHRSAQPPSVRPAPRTRPTSTP